MRSGCCKDDAPAGTVCEVVDGGDGGGGSIAAQGPAEVVTRWR